MSADTTRFGQNCLPRGADKVLGRGVLDGVPWPFRWFYRLMQARVVLGLIFVALIPLILLIVVIVEWVRGL